MFGGRQGCDPGRQCETIIEIVDGNPHPNPLPLRGRGNRTLSVPKWNNRNRGTTGTDRSVDLNDLNGLNVLNEFKCSVISLHSNNKSFPYPPAAHRVRPSPLKSSGKTDRPARPARADNPRRREFAPRPPCHTPV